MNQIDGIISQKCLKPPYINDKNVVPRLVDVRQPSKPVERSRQYALKEQDKQDTTQDWLIPFVLKKQSIVVLYAPAGSGKTFAAWGLCKFAYLTKKVSEVFYFDGDNGLNTIFDRGVDELYKYKKFNYIALNNPRIYREFGEVDNFKLLKDIASSGEDLSGMLFVFDSMKDFVGNLSMESTDDMKSYFVNYVAKLRLRGATVVLLHHTNKAVKQKDGTINTNMLTFTGSQQILNSLETAYMVVPKNGETAQIDGYLVYDFLGEKRRAGGNNFELVVYTATEKGHKNLDIELKIPDIKSHIRNKKELKMIEKIENILATGDIELSELPKKLKRNRRDALLYRILQDYELIFWERYSLDRKKYLKLIRG
jgi:hypothetical protein